MFGKKAETQPVIFFGGAGETHNHRTEIHEHRAPTDDSIRLTKEMEQKILDSIISSIAVVDNPIKGQIVAFKSNEVMSGLTLRLSFVFELNGKRGVVNHSISDIDVYNKSTSPIEAFRKLVIEAFATKMLVQGFEDATKETLEVIRAFLDGRK